MNNANMNICLPEIDTRATRNADAKLVLGEVEIVFKAGTVRMSTSTFIRETNREQFADMERILHNYIGEAVNGDTLKKLADDLLPIAQTIRIF